MALNPLFYYSTIEAGARLGLTTADIWSMIKDQAENAGFASAGVSASAVSTMRGQAGAIIRAERALAASPGDQAISGAMIGTPAWARDLGSRNALPMWQARFPHTTLVNGVEQTDWRTVTFTGTLPSSVDALRRRVQRNAGQMAKNYGSEHVSIGDISLMAV